MAKNYFKVLTTEYQEIYEKCAQEHEERLNNYASAGLFKTNKQMDSMFPMGDRPVANFEIKSHDTVAPTFYNFKWRLTTVLCCEDYVEQP